MEAQSLKVATFNVRGLSVPTKRQQLWDVLHKHQIEVAMITETWLRHPTDISNTNYQVVRGPSGTHQGVAIAMARSKVAEFKAIHQDLHTLHTIAYQLKIRRP